MIRTSTTRTSLIMATLLCPVMAHGSPLRTLYDFTGATASGGAFVVDKQGIMYGTASAGGSAGHGTVFSFNPNTKAVTVLYNFLGGNDGATPAAGMTLLNGVLYGATEAGGAANDGTVFRLDTKTGVEEVLHSFSGSDGSLPQSGPIMAPDGKLYGSAYRGGANTYGSIYKIDPSSGVWTPVYNFSAGADGAYPQSLTAGPAGLLYGSTSGGGSSGYGTLFTLDPSSGKEAVIYNCLIDPTADLPAYNVVFDANGLMYGYINTAYQSSLTYELYQFNLSTKKLTLLTYDGICDPGGPLTIDSHGNIYGIFNGFNGLVFSYNTATGTETNLFSFRGKKQGIEPQGVIIGKDGNLYGTTLAGGPYYENRKSPGYGTIFSIKLPK